jgi:glycosyltransferase involved in cell wall biosynthesis
VADLSSKFKRGRYDDERDQRRTGFAMKVSVSIVTYNQEKFIAKALDSVLMQRTNFDYEIVIGEDCSTDTTRAILLDYQKRHPGIISLLLNDKNLGGNKNIEQTMQACRSEYVAVLDGDDYWTSTDKLQKQVDFLDSHPECSACFHDVLIIHADESREPTHYRHRQKAFCSVEDLLLDNFIPTSAVVFRRHLFERLPYWISRLKMGDWPFHILNALQGRIGYIDETMGVYLVHHGGVWSMQRWQYHVLSVIELFEALRIHLDRKYRGIINPILCSWYFSVSGRYENEGDLVNARTYLNKAIRKHVATIGDSKAYFHRVVNDAVTMVDDAVRPVNGSILFKSFLRLYVIPALRSYLIPVLKPCFPTLYKLLRAGFCKAFLGQTNVS